jgi:hypothetical protein
MCLKILHLLVPVGRSVSSKPSHHHLQIRYLQNKPVQFVDPISNGHLTAGEGRHPVSRFDCILI